jgi:hypothetical protein
MVDDNQSDPCHLCHADATDNFLSASEFMIVDCNNASSNFGWHTSFQMLIRIDCNVVFLIFSIYTSFQLVINKEISGF